MTSTLNAPVGTARDTGRRGTWALWGTAAGVGGVLTNMVLAADMPEELRNSGEPAEIVAALSQGQYHLSAITGYLTVACLLVFAAGLARWGRDQASDSLALRVLPTAVVASAGALIVAYGVKGQLAAYLDGGFNDTYDSDTVRYTMFILDDLAGYFSWWGVAIAAACLAVLAFRDRLVARWIGVLGAIAFVVPVLFLLVVGFTGFSGVVTPLFLIVAGVGLSRQRG